MKSSRRAGSNYEKNKKKKGKRGREATGPKLVVILVSDVVLFCFDGLVES